MFPAAVLTQRLRTLMISRLFIGSALLFYAQFVFPAERIVFYTIIVTIAGLSIVYLLWSFHIQGLHLLAFVQIGCDLILESALVYYTGGTDSSFATVYALSILTAGFVLSPLASFYVAAGSSVCFIGVVLLGYWRWISPSFPSLPSMALTARWDTIYLFYASYVRVTVFFLVAVLTYYFSRKIWRLEDEIKIQERLVFLGGVISNIAHEIRNPLASIGGSVELILKQLGPKLNEKQQKLMNAVVEETERINRIFSGLLDYSRMTKLQLEEVSVEQFLDQIFLLMRHQESFNAKVKMEPLYKGKHIKVRVDPEHMKQVLMNIITNAFQAMPDGGCLRVDTSTNRTTVAISIEDTGNGMDRKILSSVFMPFKTNKSNGTGLGLAQAYKVVNQHGGQLSIRSEKGKGTHVDVFLPMS